MDASNSLRRVDWTHFVAPRVVRLARTAAGSCLALVTAGAVLVFWRRAGGALVEPLPPSALLGLGGGLALVALTSRLAFPPPAAGAGLGTWAIWAAPSVALLAWAGCLPWDEQTANGIAGLWSVLLIEEGWSWSRLWRPRLALESTPAPQRPDRFAPPDRNVASAAASQVDDPGQRGDWSSDEAVTQQLTRRRDNEAGEVIEGWFRAALAPGQRYATAHIAICPPLDGVPRCFAEPMDGTSATVKIAQVLPYGVRFEIKLDEPAREEASVAIEFSIQGKQEGEGRQDEG